MSSVWSWRRQMVIPMKSNVDNFQRTLETSAGGEWTATRKRRSKKKKLLKKQNIIQDEYGIKMEWNARAKKKTQKEWSLNLLSLVNKNDDKVWLKHPRKPNHMRKHAYIIYSLNENIYLSSLHFSFYARSVLKRPVPFIFIYENEKNYFRSA